MSDFDEMAERHLDRRYPPPGSSAYREPDISADEWREAYFALADVALRQLAAARDRPGLDVERLERAVTAADFDCEWNNSHDIAEMIAEKYAEAQQREGAGETVTFERLPDSTDPHTGKPIKRWKPAQQREGAGE